MTIIPPRSLAILLLNPVRSHWFKINCLFLIGNLYCYMSSMILLILVNYRLRIRCEEWHCHMQFFFYDALPYIQYNLTSRAIYISFFIQICHSENTVVDSEKNKV